MESESMDLNAWAEHVLSIAAERFERRLSEEIASLRVQLTQEMHAGFAAIRKELADQRVEMLKWSFAFWIGQLGAMAALLSFMLRAR
jgi:hypothetical protein